MGKMDHVQIPQATSGRRTSVTDTRGRVLGDLRISVTDRCNLRCRYCMPKELFGEAFKFMPRSELLTFDDIGGTDIALTTNGVLLTDEKARALKAAGLHRITVSLDALEPDVFQYMSGSTVEPARILAAINAASAAGLNPVKVNMVVQRGVNEKSILPMAEHFRGTGHILRFIEFMDVGTSNRWQMKDVVTADEIRQLIDDKWPLERVPRRHLGEVAQRYRYRDGGGDIGLIASVTQPFCGACTRLRLSADGKFYTCLFAPLGHDLRAAMRAGISDGEIEDRIAAIWAGRSDRYSELRAGADHAEAKRPEMWQIGG